MICQMQELVDQVRVVKIAGQGTKFFVRGNAPSLRGFP